MRSGDDGRDGLSCRLSGQQRRIDRESELVERGLSGLSLWILPVQKRSAVLADDRKVLDERLEDEEKSRASTFRSRLNYWQRGAECRGIVWALTEDEFASLWGLPCTYCGGSIETIGIDRKNSNIGYRLHNCVPCCSRCNMMKGSRSTEEFVGQCMAVAAKWAGDDSWRVPSKPVKAEKRKKKHKKKKKREVKLRIEVFGVSPGVQLSLF
mgnify:CR=1 FL=1